MSSHHICESEQPIAGPVSGLTIESSSSLFSCDVPIVIEVSMSMEMPDFAISTADTDNLKLLGRYQFKSENKVW